MAGFNGQGMGRRSSEAVQVFFRRDIDALSDYSDDTPVYLKHDGGYTYGGITWDDLEEGSEIE